MWLLQVIEIQVFNLKGICTRNKLTTWLRRTQTIGCHPDFPPLHFIIYNWPLQLLTVYPAVCPFTFKIRRPHSLISSFALKWRELISKLMFMGHPSPGKDSGWCRYSIIPLSGRLLSNLHVNDLGGLCIRFTTLAAAWRSLADFWLCSPAFIENMNIFAFAFWESA